MAQLDFRQALSAPEEKLAPSAKVNSTVASNSVASAAALNSSKNLVGGIRLSRSGWANITFVTIACAGGLICAFYFFNGAELLRAAAAWSREFLYPRPSALVANADTSNPGNADPSAEKSGKSSSGRDKDAPFANPVWSSDLSQPLTSATFTAINPTGSISPGSTQPFGGSSGGSGFLSGLNTLVRGADALFQSFYQTAINMVPKNVTTTASKTLASTRNRVLNTKQTVTSQAANAAQQAKATAQSGVRSAINNTAGGLGSSGSGLGGGVGNGGLGGAGGLGGLGGLGGVGGLGGLGGVGGIGGGLGGLGGLGHGGIGGGHH